MTAISDKAFGGGSSGAAASILLDYQANTDISVSASASTWTDYLSAQSFTVPWSGEIQVISVRGTIYSPLSTSEPYFAVRVVVDGTLNYLISGDVISTTANENTNALAGAGTVSVSGLTAGTHTVKIQVWNQVSGSFFTQASSVAGQSLGLQVVTLGGGGSPPSVVVGGLAPIQQIVVPSGGQATVQFTGIPQTYQDLQLRWSAHTAYSGGDDTLFVQFNGDTNSSNYTDAGYYTGASGSLGYNVGQSSSLGTFMAYLDTDGSSYSTTFAGGTLDLFDYASTHKWKVGTSASTLRESSAFFNVNESIEWVSTAAITSITLTPSSGSNFSQYTVFTLYGIAGPGQIAPSIGHQKVTITADYTALLTDDIVFVNAAGGNIVLTLPSASAAAKPLTVKRIDTSTYSVTVVARSGQLVEGAPDQYLAVGDAITMDASGSSWYFI